ERGYRLIDLLWIVPSGLEDLLCFAFRDMSVGFGLLDHHVQFCGRGGTLRHLLPLAYLDGWHLLRSSYDAQSIAWLRAPLLSMSEPLYSENRPRCRSRRPDRSASLRSHRGEQPRRWL